MRLRDQLNRREEFYAEIKINHFTRKIMPSFFKKIFGGKKNGHHTSNQSQNLGAANQNDNMYTAILATRSQQNIAEDVMDSLQRSGEVIVDGKDDVTQGQADAKASARQAVQYMHQTRVTAVVILSSDELTSFFGGSSAVQLQVTGENVNLDSGIISDSFKNNQKIRDKLLIVVLPGKSASYPSFLQGVDVLHLGSDKSIWNKEIVGKFMQKITLRK